MKIALLIPWFLPDRGGAEIGAWELALNLSERGHEVSVIAPRYSLRWPTYEEMSGVKVYRYTFKFPFPYRRFAEIIHCFIAKFTVDRLLDKIQPDVLNLQYLIYTGYAGMAWAKKNNKPTVLTLIGNDVFDPYYVPCEHLGTMNKWMVRAADKVTATSRFVLNVVLQKFGNPVEPITLVPYGVNLAKFKPCPPDELTALRQKLGLPTDRTLVLTVQRLHERKGVHVYIQAAKHVLEKRPDTTFVIVGDGPERARLEATARDLGIQSNIIFTGKVTHEGALPEYYRACDVFGFHTFHEGFGIVLLEAMASGLPVVTTKAGGTLDIIESGKNGYLVEPNDPKALADSILKLVDGDPVFRKAMGELNRNTAEREYSWKLHTDRYEKMFQDLINKK